MECFGDCPMLLVFVSLGGLFLYWQGSSSFSSPTKGENAVIKPTIKCLFLSCVSPPQPCILEVLLAADLQGFRHTDGVEAAHGLLWSRTDSDSGAQWWKKGITRATSDDSLTAAPSRGIIYSWCLFRFFFQIRLLTLNFVLANFEMAQHQGLHCVCRAPAHKELRHNNEVGMEQRDSVLVTQGKNSHGCICVEQMRDFEVPLLFNQGREWVL